MTERPSIDELISAMPISWRQRWCNNELCGFLGCANGSGRLIFYGYTQEDHQNWADNHPNELKL